MTTIRVKCQDRIGQAWEESHDFPREDAAYAWLDDFQRTLEQRGGMMWWYEVTRQGRLARSDTR